MIQRLLVILVATIAISGCSLLGPKSVKIETAPVERQIIHPILPREVQLTPPNFYVISEAVIANPCKKVKQEDGTEKRPRTCDVEDKEYPNWPAGYTYLDRFLDDMKSMNNGEVVFVAMSIGDYKTMTANIQELRRYIKQLGNVVVYYREITNADGTKSLVAEIEKQ